jgi:hypothetical protein
MPMRSSCSGKRSTTTEHCKRVTVCAGCLDPREAKAPQKNPAIYYYGAHLIAAHPSPPVPACNSAAILIKNLAEIAVRREVLRKNSAVPLIYGLATPTAPVKEPLISRRLSRSWTLVKASASVLRQDKELLVFPMVSLVALGFVLAAFVLPIFGLGLLAYGLRRQTARLVRGRRLPGRLPVLLLPVLRDLLLQRGPRRRGDDPPGRWHPHAARRAQHRHLAHRRHRGLRVHRGHRRHDPCAIQDAVGFIGKIVVAMLGVGWTLATYLVVPVLVAEKIGPIDAIKESAVMLKKDLGRET